MNLKILRTAACLVAAVLLFRMPAEALSAEKAVLLDGKRVLYEKQGDSRSLIASTTKIMTGLLAAERCNVLEPVKIPKEAVGVEGSSIYLQPGEVLTVQELLYGLMLESGNDAAAALAIHMGGSIEGFAELMNRKARDLGMTGTHFENPHGLDGKQHYSTARDLGVLGSYAMKNPIFLKTVSTKKVRVGDRYFKNHNRLLWQYPGCDGIKTGYTRAAGRILVSSAIRSGRRLTAVTINDPDDWNTHKRLLDRGFSRLREQQLVKKGQVLQDYPVLSGVKSAAPLVAAEDYVCLLAKGEQALTVLPGPGFVYAPVVKGAAAGRMLVLVSGEILGSLPVCWGETVEEKPEKEHFLKRIFGGRS